VQGGLIGRLVARYGEKRLLIAGCAMVGISLGLVPLAGWTGSFPFFLVTMFLLAAGSGICSPSASSLLSRATSAGSQGHVMGVGQSLGALGRVLGPAMAGALFQISAASPFLLGGGMILACAGMAVRFRPVDNRD
jgi:DHA1 family tetracycline resistance protein-like MFS transporter